MTRIPCIESRKFAALNRVLTGRQSRKTAISPNDVLVNLAWPLILILSLAGLAASGQEKAISEMSKVVKRWEQKGTTEVLLELWKQALIRRVDAVCIAQEQRWKLNLFPIADRVATEQGWPVDPDFGRLCTKTHNQLDDREVLTLTLYEAALQYNEDGLGQMFDPIVFPGSAPLVSAPNILDQSDEAEERRAFALHCIRERCDHWNAHVTELQLHLVEKMLDEPTAAESVRADDSSMIKAKIASAFRDRGYPLLPHVL